MTDKTNALRDYHAPVWDEPVVMQLGYPGRRGQVFAQPARAATDKAGAASTLIPKGLARTTAPALPEMSEPEVQRHYLHLCQETLGMLNISLFGTCTMKYNARVSEAIAQRPFVADMHPLQPDESMQGILQAIHEFDLGLRALSGMDQFIFQAGGGADAAYTNCVVTRAYHKSRGEL